MNFLLMEDLPLVMDVMKFVVIRVMRGLKHCQFHSSNPGHGQHHDLGRDSNLLVQAHGWVTMESNHDNWVWTFTEERLDDDTSKFTVCKTYEENHSFCFALLRQYEQKYPGGLHY
jgi:hypothetical protein